MKIAHSKQVWKGIFTYQDGYEDIDQYIEVDFTMILNFTEDTFIGTSTDSESEKAFNKPALVKGFIDGDKISFVLKYPCSYFKDENGKIVLDENSEHPDIHYLGYFDEDKKSVSGTWEMTIYSEPYYDGINEGFLDEILNGTFEIRRES